MATEQHTTVAGEVIEYERPCDELARFLSRIVAATNDPGVSEQELVDLVYGPGNPLLDQTIFEGRGAVTKEVFADPLYHVMLDLLDQKRVRARALDPARALAEFTMTVTEVAMRLEMSDSAVRQAIKAKHLAAIKRGKSYLVDRRSVATYRNHVVRRGPRPQPALRVRMGTHRGASFRVKAPSLEVIETKTLDGGELMQAIVSRFERAAIAFSREATSRMFVLEPSEKSSRFDFDDFGITGKYRIVEKINNPERASLAFRSFEAK
jgi:excisionase family DNA binding protein